jgi:predicted acylesterase/phospholipase RssA
VIGSGGSWGAAGGGTCQAWNRQYDIVSGVSTGSTLAPLVALGEYDRLRVAYTSVTNPRVLNVNPLTRRNKLNLCRAAWRLASRKVTLGESEGLKNLIDQTFTREDFLRLEALQKRVIVAALEIRQAPHRVMYGDSSLNSFEDFKTFMWASANVPVLMSLVKMGSYELVDGGTTEMLSLCRVLAMGATEVDVIIHRPRPESYDRGPTRSIIHLVRRLYDILRGEVEDNDLQQGLLLAQTLGAKVNVCWLPKKLENALQFDKATMEGYWDLGYRTAFDEGRFDRYDFSEQTLSPILQL